MLLSTSEWSVVEGLTIIKAWRGDYKIITTILMV